MIELGVNIDHVATLRQARRTWEPDPCWAAVEAHLGGADGITIAVPDLLLPAFQPGRGAELCQAWVAGLHDPATAESAGEYFGAAHGQSSHWP